MPNQRLLLLSKGFFALCFAFYVAMSYQLAHKNLLYFDDAYMYLRYAGNVAAHGIYGWNPDAHSFGCISIPYTFYIVLLKSIGFGEMGQPALLIFASASWGLVAIVSGWRIGISFFREADEQGLAIFWAMAGLFCINPVFLKNATTGMETAMSICANIWVIWAAFKAEKRGFDWRGLFIWAVLAYFAFLVRPDNGIYAVLFPAFFMWAKSAGLRKAAQFWLMLAVFFAIDTALKWHFFGNPLPLPFYHKSTMFSDFIMPEHFGTRQNLVQFIQSLVWLFWAVLFVVARKNTRTAVAFYLPLLLTVCYYFTVAHVMGLNARYYAPSVAFIIMPAFYFIATRDSFVISAKRLLVGLFLSSMVVVVDFYVSKISLYERLRSETIIQPHENNTRAPFTDHGESHEKMLEIIHKLPAGAKIAAGEHGRISALNPHVFIIDMYGLHNQEIALSGQWPDAILDREKPVLIHMIPYNYVALKQQVVTGHFFQKDYRYYEGCAQHGIAVRRDSPLFEMICAELESVGCYTVLEIGQPPK